MTAYDTGNSRRYYNARTHKVVPIDAVVLDLSGLNVEELVNVIRWAGASYAGVADQIEAQMKTQSAPMDEPAQLGAVVTASQWGEVEDSERPWVRYQWHGSNPWIDDYGHTRAWEDLRNPREAQS